MGILALGIIALGMLALGIMALGKLSWHLSKHAICGNGDTFHGVKCGSQKPPRLKFFSHKDCIRFHTDHAWFLTGEILV